MQQVPATNFSRSVSQDTVSVKRGLDKRRRCFSIDPTCESRKRERGRRRIRKKERSVLDDKSSRFIPYVSSHSFSFLFLLLSSRSRRVSKFRFTSDVPSKKCARCTKSRRTSKYSVRVSSPYPRVRLRRYSTRVFFLRSAG